MAHPLEVLFVAVFNTCATWVVLTRLDKEQIATAACASLMGFLTLGWGMFVLRWQERR